MIHNPYDCHTVVLVMLDGNPHDLFYGWDEDAADEAAAEIRRDERWGRVGRSMVITTLRPGG